MKTEAIIFVRPGEVQVDEVTIPDLTPTDALLEIEYSSISIGTERWCLLGAIQAGPGKLIEFPFVPGYQAAGTVREVGAKVRDIRQGERVYSRLGRFSAERFFSSYWGAHLRYHVTDCQTLIKLPEGVSTLEASGLALAQVGFDGAIRPQVSQGDVAVVIGDGLLGLYVGQVLRYRGARVIMSGHHQERLELAGRYGAADEVVNSKQEDLVEYVRKAYPDGVPITVETASKNELIQMAIGLLEPNGQFVLLGYYPEGECLIDTHWVRARAITMYCPCGIERKRMEKTLELTARGHLKMKELVTHEFPFTEAPKAYRMILEKSTHFLGVVFDWTTH